MVWTRGYEGLKGLYAETMHPAMKVWRNARRQAKKVTREKGSSKELGLLIDLNLGRR